MSQPIVTQRTPQPGPPPTTSDLVALIFNDSSGPPQVVDIIATKHAFVPFETWETVDEQGRPAWVLVARCETATVDQLLDQVGSRLPDYIQARRFPPSRVAQVRSSGTRIA